MNQPRQQQLLAELTQLETEITSELAAGNRANSARLGRLVQIVREMCTPAALPSASPPPQPSTYWTYDEDEDVHSLRVGIFRLNVFACQDRPDAFYGVIGVDTTIVAMDVRTPRIGLVETKLMAERAVFGKLRDAAGILGFTLTKATP